MKKKYLLFHFLNLLYISSLYKARAENRKDEKIIIIGAGSSGIAAAMKLFVNGYKFIHILEASGNFGGRGHTRVRENILDRNCHGNVEFYPSDSDFAFFRSDGRKLSTLHTYKLVKIAYDILYSESSQDERNQNTSFGEVFRFKYWDRLRDSSYTSIDKDTKEKVLKYFERQVNAEQGSNSWYTLSSRNISEPWLCPGQSVIDRVDKHYTTVTFSMFGKKSPDSKIMLDVLRQVEFKSEVTKIQYDTKISIVQVNIKNKPTQWASRVICTIPLGVLKEKHKTLFQPMLPSRKREIINDISFGTVDRIRIQFHHPIVDHFNYALIWLDNEVKKLKKEANGDWLDGLIGFYRSQSDPKTWFAWITGDKAKNMERKNDQQIKDGIGKVLKMFLKNQYTKYNYTIKSAKPDAKWYSDPHFRGSHTFHTTNADARKASPRELSKPIENVKGDPFVLFAGEATATKHFGNYKGSTITGWREAQRLIDPSFIERYY